MSLLNTRKVAPSSKMALRVMVAALFNASLITFAWSAQTDLADQPIITTVNVPANVVFPISVEYPTAISVAHPSAFAANTKYDGYFDPYKCYDYDGAKGYFYPVGTAATTTFNCTGHWSGTLLNWATMQTIDLFRWVMTGGYRSTDLPANSGDTNAALTVLQRAYASNQGSSTNFPQRSISSTLAKNYTPYTTSVTFDNWSKGDKVVVTVGGNATSLFTKVKVCDPSYLESNCTKYQVGSKVAYKPEGLMQQNRHNMMFSVFAYLLRNDGVAHGGVMRARSRHIMADGETAKKLAAGVVRSGVAAYEVNEMSDMGAYVANPDTVDAAASPAGAETHSGAMNYINSFGMISQYYMTYDSVSLIFAEALKYMKGLNPTPSYLSDLNSGTKSYQDNFQVVSDWKRAASTTTMDPILRWCQKNFFVGIGDVNSWYDKGLSGNSGAPAGVDANMGSKLTADAWTAAVGALEPGMSDLAARSNLNGDGTGYDYSSSSASSPSSCCGGNGNYIAGMAYYANIEDIRTDISKPSDKKTTIQTYWVDVLEFQKYKGRNQYWLAAKYGGFVDTNGNLQPDLDSEWKSTTTVPAVMPANYFPAANAQMLADGLKQAFQQIRQAIAEGAGVGVSSPSLTLGTGAAATKVFQVTYDSTNGWGGTVKGLNINSIAADGTLNTTAYFNTDTSLFSGKPANWWNAGQRIIATGNWSGTTFTPTAFEWSSLTAAQQTALGSQAVLNYLRGDKSAEGTTFRARTKALGDIVDSQAVFLGASNDAYSDDYNPGYSGYKSDTASRTPVVFVGANDGMLHAINANTGVELWAYVPSFLFQGPSSPATPAVDGLQALSSPTYAHHYYVDSTPYIKDVDFGNTGGTVGAADWHTLLVGGLGKGGKGYYALDVSNAAAITSVTDLTTNSGDKKARVLWEFTDPDMGFTYGRPVIVKSPRWGWVVILTGGYNNVTGSTGNEGKGVIYILNAKTGARLQTVYTNEGSATNPSGFAHASAFVPEYADYTALDLYGGDLLGKVWRFDLSSATADVPTPTSAFAKLELGPSAPQPVTTEPQVEYESGSQNRWVFVGTGRLLHSNDSGSSQVQSLYAIRDGKRALPSGITLPITRGNLTPVSDADLVTGVMLAASTPMGWYHDLTGSSSGAMERVIINPLAVSGADIMTWVGSIPSTDPCSPGGTSRYYKTTFGNGRSLLLDSGLNPIAYRASGDQTVGYAIIKNGTTTGTLITTTNSIKAPSDPQAIVKKPAVNNWRLIGQ